MTNGTAVLEPKNEQRGGLQPGVPLRLRGLQWNDYLAISDIIGDRRFRTNYGNGELEILMPSSNHEIWVAMLGRLVELLTMVMKLDLKSGGQTTLRREDLEKGLEPDRCYYLENEPKVRAKLKLDLRIDPPPDLALEIEITNSVEPRMRIYAGLGVPEVWRYDGEVLSVHQLVAKGEYIVAERSKFFPFLPIEELVRFLQQYGTISETVLFENFFEWAREQRDTNWLKS